MPLVNERCIVCDVSNFGVFFFLDPQNSKINNELELDHKLYQNLTEVVDVLLAPVAPACGINDL